MAPSRCCAAATGSLEGSEKPKPSKALTRIPLDLHCLAREVILVQRRSTLRRSIAIVGLMAALSLGSCPAFAFQQENPPPPDATQATPQPNAPALQLATPGLRIDHRGTGSGKLERGCVGLRSSLGRIWRRRGLLLKGKSRA